MEKITKYYYRFEDEDIKSIKKQMIDLDLNWSKLAKKMNVSRAYISDMKNGNRNVTEGFLNKLENCGIIVADWR